MCAMTERRDSRQECLLVHPGLAGQYYLLMIIRPLLCLRSNLRMELNEEQRMVSYIKVHKYFFLQKFLQLLRQFIATYTHFIILNDVILFTSITIYHYSQTHGV